MKSFQVLHSALLLESRLKPVWFFFSVRPLWRIMIGAAGEKFSRSAATDAEFQ
jgi:hypothetical protein